MNTTLLEAFNRRYATKVFDASKKLTDDDLQTLVDALVYCPSSYWLQPWRFLVIQNDTVKQSLVASCYGQQQVADCDALFVMCRKTTFEAANIDAYIQDIMQTRAVSHELLEWYEMMMKQAILDWWEEEKNIWAEKQIYIALWFLLETAALLAVDTCPMEWFVPEDISKLLWLEEQWLHPVLLCPAGYRSEQDTTQSRKKVRYDKKEIVTFIS